MPVMGLKTPKTVMKIANITIFGIEKKGTNIEDKIMAKRQQEEIEIQS